MEKKISIITQVAINMHCEHLPFKTFKFQQLHQNTCKGEGEGERQK